ncbi:MAG: DUF1127 domain-containing protein [Paracoccaceae bacterium]
MTFLRMLWQRFQQRRQRHRAIRELRRYDDRLLADIGIFRDEIEAYVDGRLTSRGAANEGAEVVHLAPCRDRQAPARDIAA